MSVVKVKEKTVYEDLQKFAAEFDPFMRHFFDEQAIASAPAARPMIQNLSEFCLRGGKRLRPYLVSRAYHLFGGNNRDDMMIAALLPELVHGFLLIHDDVMDRDDERRGGPTLHKVYEGVFQSRDSAHLGNSMAILAGDLLYNLASEALSSLSVPGLRFELWQEMQRAVRKTILGQELDLRLSQKDDVAIDERLAMYQYKTAYYSFDAPVRIGGVLAGAEEGDLERLSGFAIQCGVAFQITDDLLDGESLSDGKARAQECVNRAKQSLELFSAPRYDQVARRDLAALADFILEREV